MKITECLSLARLEEILNDMRRVRAVLLGDMCLDVYWSADMTKSHLSRETPHYPLPVVEERMSPGAGGNVVACMAALKPALLCPVGILGDDWRGECLKKEFAGRGVSLASLLTLPGRFTNAYCKPMRFGYAREEVEDPRLDFESFSPIDEKTEDALISLLQAAAKDADVICVADQFACGCVTDRVRAAVNSLGKSKRVLVDSRARIGEYRHALLKPNELECARALQRDVADFGDTAKMQSAVRSLSEKTSGTVCVTGGSAGCSFEDHGTFTKVEACPLSGPLDPVGAGDCFLSALALSLAAGATMTEAASVANLASGVSVQKIGTTGSASAEEILTLYGGLL